MGQSSYTLLAFVGVGTQGCFFKEISLAGTPTQAVVDGRRVSEPMFDRRTRLWIGNLLEGDTPQVALFAADRQARFNGVRKAFAKYDVQLTSWDADFNHLIVKTDGGDDSGTYWLADLTKHSVESIGQAYPDVKETDVGDVRAVDWKAADGMALHGVLTPPARTPGSQPSGRSPAAWWSGSQGLSVLRLVGPGVCLPRLCRVPA